MLLTATLQGSVKSQPSYERKQSGKEFCHGDTGSHNLPWKAFIVLLSGVNMKSDDRTLIAEMHHHSQMCPNHTGQELFILHLFNLT